MILEIQDEDLLMQDGIAKNPKEEGKCQMGGCKSTRTEGSYLPGFRLQVNLNREDNCHDNGKLSICDKKKGICLEFSKAQVIRLRDELKEMLPFMEGSIE